MEKKFSVGLAGGAETNVLFAKDIKDLSNALSSYGENVFWVFDTNSARLFSSLPEKRIVLESGEVNKNMKSLEAIISSALSFSSARDTRFIAFGGGVVCDMTALASSLYMRGTRLTLVPTTLLCMVDASVGGKTAIDYMGGKNLVGTFYPADDVIISVDTLRTLPEKEFRCGLGEVIKHAFLSEDSTLFNFLSENRDRIMRKEKAVLEELVYLSLFVKCSFIEKDPLEKKGIRSYLNLGHTFAHALESMAGYKISHGEAVAWGLGRALEASTFMDLVPSSFAENGISLLKSYGYDMDYRIGRGDWISFAKALMKDKKKSMGCVKFVLLSGFGHPQLMSLDNTLVQKLCIESARVKF